MAHAVMSSDLRRPRPHACVAHVLSSCIFCPTLVQSERCLFASVCLLFVPRMPLLAMGDSAACGCLAALPWLCLSLGGRWHSIAGFSPQVLLSFCCA